MRPRLRLGLTDELYAVMIEHCPWTDLILPEPLDAELFLRPILDTSQLFGIERRQGSHARPTFVPVRIAERPVLPGETSFPYLHRIGEHVIHDPEIASFERFTVRQRFQLCPKVVRTRLPIRPRTAG